MKNKLIIIGKRSNLSQHLYANKKNVSLISGSSLNQLFNEISQVETCNIIYNLFYASSLLGDRNNPKDFIKYTLEMLAEFVSICQKTKNISTLIYSSSSAVYGSTKEISRESDIPCPISLNGIIKLSSEMFLTEHLKNSGINLIIARIFNMYGGNDQFSVISKIINAFENNLEFELSNSGSAIRDFIHVDDVAIIYKKLIDLNYQGIVNIGTGENTKIVTLIGRFKTLYNRNLKIKNVITNEINKSTASTDKLFKIIGNYKFKSIF